MCQVPVLDDDTVQSGVLKSNCLVRYRAMVQNTLEPEYYNEAMEEVGPAGSCSEGHQRPGSPPSPGDTRTPGHLLAYIYCA